MLIIGRRQHKRLSRTLCPDKRQTRQQRQQRQWNKVRFNKDNIWKNSKWKQKKNRTTMKTRGRVVGIGQTMDKQMSSSFAKLIGKSLPPARTPHNKNKLCTYVWISVLSYKWGSQPILKQWGIWKFHRTGIISFDRKTFLILTFFNLLYVQDTYVF